jgi:hypothetical protein
LHELVSTQAGEDEDGEEDEFLDEHTGYDRGQRVQESPNRPATRIN